MRSKLKKVTIATTAALLTGMGIILPATTALAATGTQQIDALYSPGNAGRISSTTITWTDDYHVSVRGNLEDLAGDGHGPYAHLFAEYPGGDHPQFIASHNTKGAKSTIAFSGSYTEQGRPLQFIDVWNCNGGTSTGSGNDGCYGRRYFNQSTFPGQGSQSLGSTNSIY